MRWTALIVASTWALAACSETTERANRPPDPPPSDLSGTWDVVGTHGADAPVSITVTLHRDDLSVVTDGGSLIATRSGDTWQITYTEGARVEALLATGTGGSLALGAFPIDLSGAWKLSTNPDDGVLGCTTQLAPGAVTASCPAVGYLPWWMPRPDGSASGQRDETLSSMFGELGGVWSVQLQGGGACTFRFDGASVSSSCTGADRASGTMEATFSGDELSGHTNGGIEFSAKRR